MTASSSSRPGGSRGPGDPNVATLLTWVLPGAGHLYLRDFRFGFTALAIVEGLFVLGYILSDAATPEFLDPELRGRFALVLTPEAWNLGGLLYLMRETGFPNMAVVPREWPPLVMEGSLLMALSGILNVCLMVKANVDARTNREERERAPSPALFVLFAWLVPGLGHWLQGRKRRAVIVFLVLVGTFALGTLLADFSNLSRERHFYYWAGQFLIGLPAIVVEYASGRPPVTDEIPFMDAGLTFACVAGLLNVMAMLDVERHAEAQVFEEPDDEVVPAAPEEGAA